LTDGERKELGMTDAEKAELERLKVVAVKARALMSAPLRQSEEHASGETFGAETELDAALKNAGY
jgi:hypothetical protein